MLGTHRAASEAGQGTPGALPSRATHWRAGAKGVEEGIRALKTRGEEASRSHCRQRHHTTEKGQVK